MRKITIVMFVCCASILLTSGLMSASAAVPNSVSPGEPVYTVPPMITSNGGGDILVYSSDWNKDPGDTYPVVALNNLGLAYTYFYGDPDGFKAALTSKTWGLVIIDEPSDINEAWDELVAYIAGGGRLIYSTWYMFDMPSHPIWAAMGVSYVTYFTVPKDVYQWTPAHPVFNTPNLISNPMTGFSDEWSCDGEIVSTVGDGAAIGGSTATPSDQAMLVVAKGGRTIFNGFLWAEMNGDWDSDGKKDGVELIENEIVFTLYRSVGGAVYTVNVSVLLKPAMAAAFICVVVVAYLRMRRLRA